MFQLKCYINAELELAICEASCLGVAVIPTVEGADVVDACSDMNSFYHKLAGELPWQCVADGDVVQAHEVAVVELHHTSAATRANGVQAGELVGWIIRCQYSFLYVLQVLVNMEPELSLFR